jgi:hypothetical protein
MPSSTAKSERRSQAAKTAVAGRPRDAKGHLLPKTEQAAREQPPAPVVDTAPPIVEPPTTPPVPAGQGTTDAGGDAKASAPFRGRGLRRLRERRQRSTS